MTKLAAHIAGDLAVLVAHPLASNQPLADADLVVVDGLLPATQTATEKP